MDEKQFWHIDLKVPKVAIFLLLVFLIFSGTVFYFTEWPRPLVLSDPPFPDGRIVNYEEISMRDWFSGNSANGPAKHIWRKEYILGLGNCCENLDTPEAIFAFLDEWMTSQGWVRWEEVGDPCSSMAETEFLERNAEYVPYVPVGTKSLLSSPSTCVAVWPWKEDIYAVLVVTARY